MEEMQLQPVLIAGKWQQSQNPVDFFSATNPATKTPLPERYPVSGLEEIEEALQAGQEAMSALRSHTADDIANFLEAFADNIEVRTEELVALAHLETAYPSEPRLRSVELPRTTNQLRQAANAARDGSWSHATIDTNSNIRSVYRPLGGPVVVFGPNNFPFAFNSAAGGDFAAAIAAGNPVIAKANTGHPGTTKIFAEAAFDAVKQSGLPSGMVQLVYRTPPDVGLKLVSHPLVGATGFTGSKWAGLKLKDAADKAGKPIYLEMSSINPVYVLPGALEERSSDIAEELYNSCSLGTGQFCTKPGLVVIQGTESGERFIEQVKALFEGNKPGTLLGASGVRGIAEAVEIFQEHGAEVIAGGSEVDGDSFVFANTLLRVTGDHFLANPDAMQTEAFGTVNLIVVASDTAQMSEITTRFEGNLTGCIYSHTQDQDESIYEQIEPLLRNRVGRLINDKMPTGVAVVPSMNHGGPFPATGHPGFTAVGVPASLLRFAALHCYDNVRHHRLPLAVKDKNPTGEMWRLVDGRWTQENVA
jgi:NADP-dependent aldehyde dehydrogenase